MPDSLSEAEIQVLIALAELSDPIETPNNVSYAFYPKTLQEAGAYFRRFLLDWTDAYAALESRGWIEPAASGRALTPSGLDVARRLRLERPPIYYFYRDFYLSTAASPANHEFCERVYGKDLCQQGFMDMDQLHQLMKVTGMHSGTRVLDLGCGTGLIAEYISSITGAFVWGMDYIGEAVRMALERTRSKRDRLDFQVGNLDRLDYPPASFDVLIASDTLYMPNDLVSTLRQMLVLLAPGGRMGIYYSDDLWDRPTASPEDLAPGSITLGRALRQLGLSFDTWDFTEADRRHALLKQSVIAELAPAFDAEGHHFLAEIREAEAAGVLEAVRRGIHARYLYLVKC